jgi:hypothetical protein
MARSFVLAIGAIFIGALIMLYKVAADGLTPSFALLLGLLFVADGVLRLLAMPGDNRSSNEG